MRGSLKRPGEAADPSGMDPELQKAWRHAAIKLAAGSFALAAVLGIRIVTATPDGVEAEVAELEATHAELEPSAPALTPPSVEEEAPSSLVDRMGERVRGRLAPGDRGSSARDELVSCRLAGGTQYMRAGDCAMRGGRATLFEDEDE